ITGAEDGDVQHGPGKGSSLAPLTRERYMEVIGMGADPVVRTGPTAGRTPDLSIPDHMVQPQLGCIPDQQVKELIPESFFVRPRHEESDVERTAFCVRGGGAGAGNVAPVVNPQEPRLWEIGMHEDPQCVWSRLRLIPVRRHD